MKVKIADLRKLVNSALNKYQYNEGEIAVISEVLMYAQLRGNNQGVVKLIGKGLPKSSEAGEIKVVKDTKLSALLDGSHNQGMVVLKQAMDLALAKAKEHGFGMVGTNNTSTSTGASKYPRFIRGSFRHQSAGPGYALGKRSRCSGYGHIRYGIFRLDRSQNCRQKHP